MAAWQFCSPQSTVDVDMEPVRVREGRGEQRDRPVAPPREEEIRDAQAKMSRKQLVRSRGGNASPQDGHDNVAVPVGATHVPVTIEGLGPQ